MGQLDSTSPHEARTMPPIRLMEPSSVPEVNRILEGLIGIAETVMPGQILGYYLFGSYAQGEATTASDIDFMVLLRPRVTELRELALRDLLESGNHISRIEIDIAIRQADPVERLAPTSLKASKLLYGEDIRPAIPAQSLQELKEVSFRRVFTNICQLFDVKPPVHLPLQFPKPDDEWGGLARFSRRRKDGSKGEGLRALSSAVLWAAQAFVIHRGGPSINAKTHALVTAYQDTVGGQWVQLVATVQYVCRTLWKYRIPQDSEGKMMLKVVCSQTLEFLNFFLQDYQRFVASEALNQRVWADQCLDDVV
jgi:predicted nucleotidyltransferase